LALTSKARLRRTPKGDLLKKGQSIRLKKDCTFQIGSDLQVADKSLSRRDIFGSRTSAAAKSGAKKAETAPSHTDRRLLLNQSKHVPGANGDAGVNVEMHGSFRVVRGDSAMTLNVVKLERAEPNIKPLALLRSTPRGAMLMKGDSIRGGRVTKQLGLLGDLDVSEASDLDTPFDVTPCALET
jgi:hypothetical protein